MSKNKKKKRFNFYNVFFFGIMPITIVTILLVKTIIICDAILKINAEDIKSFLMNSNWIDIALSVISIAVSVWLGINISNLVDRKQIEGLNKQIKDLNNIIEKSKKE